MENSTLPNFSFSPLFCSWPAISMWNCWQMTFQEELIQSNRGRVLFLKVSHNHATFTARQQQRAIDLYETSRLQKGFHLMTLMAILAALFTASQGSFRHCWNVSVWSRSVLRPSGSSASMVRVLIALRRALLVSSATSFSKGGMASAPRAENLPVEKQTGFKMCYYI